MTPILTNLGRLLNAPQRLRDWFRRWHGFISLGLSLLALAISVGHLVLR